jgi:hypothetical protein
MLIFPDGSKLVVTLVSGTTLQTACAVFGQDIDASSQTFQCLSQSALATGDNTLYTVPAGHNYLVKSFSISNTSGSNAQVVLHYLASGVGASSVSTQISSTITIQPGGMVVYEDNQGWRAYNKNQSLGGTSVVGAGGLELLGSTQLTANSPYTETVKFTPRDSLLIFVRSTGHSAADLPGFRFNGSGSGYWSRYIHCAVGSTTLTNAQTVSTSLARLCVNNSVQTRSFTVYISNFATASKVGVVNSMVGTGAAGTAPIIEFGGFEWVDTVRQISEIQMLSAGSQNMLVGTAFEVYGINYAV